MGAPKGNEYWKFRDKHGRDYKYSPEALWLEAVDYFEWVKKHPIKEHKVFGTGKNDEQKHMRAMTLTGFCAFADITLETYNAYRNNENKELKKDFVRVTKRIDQIIYAQKFEGAACGMLNPVIISRDLGLVDRKDITTDDEPITGFKVTITDERGT